ncbi:unnamed protein product [Sphagnum jensenii]|uniref:Uncharacterized protein n=1 Tax=Sphagnum jensenii TaxID=128206 RepID=A0ABP1C0A8_9BRYO
MEERMKATGNGHLRRSFSLTYRHKLHQAQTRRLVDSLLLRKARRTVIGRMLGGKSSFKALQESLKLHLPATFVSATLLIRGFFLILFEDEEGATSTRKLATVEWNGLSLSFSRYNSNFDANAQGAKALLTHTIKVQFPNLHD